MSLEDQDPLDNLDLDDVPESVNDPAVLRQKLNSALAMLRPFQDFKGANGTRVLRSQTNMRIEHSPNGGDDAGGAADSEDEDTVPAGTPKPAEASALGSAWSSLTPAQKDEALRSALCAVIASLNGATGSCDAGVPKITFPGLPSTSCTT